MSRKKRMQDLRVAKDKKMKKVAIGLSVVLVAVLAFEVPKILHSGGGSTAPAPAVTTTATPSTGTPVAGTPVTGTPVPGVAITPTASSTKLANSDLSPAVGKAQLYSFSHFAGKDPFAQQVVDATLGQPDAPGQDASGQPSTSTGTTAAVTHHKSSTRVLAVTGAARIAVNGRVQVVRVGTSFPASNPHFQLVSVSHGVARIGIANGAYKSGAKTVTLSAGRSLTLVDTADGIRYQIRVVS